MEHAAQNTQTKSHFLLTSQFLFCCLGCISVFIFHSISHSFPSVYLPVAFFFIFCTHSLTDSYVTKLHKLRQLTVGNLQSGVCEIVRIICRKMQKCLPKQGVKKVVFSHVPQFMRQPTFYPDSTICGNDSKRHAAKHKYTQGKDTKINEAQRPPANSNQVLKKTFKKRKTPHS